MTCASKHSVMKKAVNKVKDGKGGPGGVVKQGVKNIGDNISNLPGYIKDKYNQVKSKIGLEGLPFQQGGGLKGKFIQQEAAKTYKEKGYPENGKVRSFRGLNQSLINEEKPALEKYNKLMKGVSQGNKK